MMMLASMATFVIDGDDGGGHVHDDARGCNTNAHANDGDGHELLIALLMLLTVLLVSMLRALCW